MLTTTRLAAECRATRHAALTILLRTVARRLFTSRLAPSIRLLVRLYPVRRSVRLFAHGMAGVVSSLFALITGVAMADTPADSINKATLHNTETRTLHSEIVGETYSLSVWLPPSYTSASQSYPVVYMLDPDLTFGIAANMTDLLSFAGEIPEVILVGIGYPEDFMMGRTRDYAPTPQPDWPGSGGADAFLAFFKTELIPFVEATYRTDSDERTLWGYSLGGLFVLYTLFNEPELFQRYIAGSPYAGWDNRFIFDLERKFYTRQKSLPVRLVITVGTEEDSFMPGYRSDIEAFRTVLKKRNYAGLALTTHLLGDETHFSGTARSYVTGIKTALSIQ